MCSPTIYLSFLRLETFVAVAKYIICMCRYLTAWIQIAHKRVSKFRTEIEADNTSGRRKSVKYVSWYRDLIRIYMIFLHLVYVMMYEYSITKRFFFSKNDVRLSGIKMKRFLILLFFCILLAWKNESKGMYTINHLLMRIIIVPGLI